MARRRTKNDDIKHVYVQYSKRITTACTLAFFVIACSLIALIAWAELSKVQIDALVQMGQMVGVFETGVIASYATNSIFEKNFAAKYGELRAAYDFVKEEDEESDSEENG